MKKLIQRIGGFFKLVLEKYKTWKSKRKTPAWIQKIKTSPVLIGIKNFCNKYSVFMHIILSLVMCFVLEWLSRHSFTEAVAFVTDHTGAYLYNSYLIFVVYSLVYLMQRQVFLRMCISAIFVMLGIINCIVLLNRVTPFGFTDLYMIADLFTMQNTNYFSADQALVAVIAIVLYALYMVKLFIKGEKLPHRIPYPVKLIFIALCFISVPFVTKGLQNQGIIASYFGNLAQGYLDNGYVYGFSTSIFDRGMSQPKDYSQETIDEILTSTNQGQDTIDRDDMPNIVVVLLESFYDVEEVKFLSTSEDPIPYFHYLEDNFSTGHLTVPVVGAGTCNSEFEVLTGMSCQFFGAGEYPQKTILKKTDCESFAADLGKLGYSSHVVHNNGGNFYSRANAFSMMGFDSFQSKEMLDITEYTPMGSWPTDDILIGASLDAMDTSEGSDFLYTITVEAHGDYPTEKIIEDPAVTVECEGKTEEVRNQWEYYINQIHEVDDFMKLYCQAFEDRGEDTLVIFFGDHLPTMGLTEDEIETGDLFQAKYVTWNNFGMSKKDADLTTYQLVSAYLDRLGIHNGTMTNYHQSFLKQGVSPSDETYRRGIEMLQYDLLYGKRYAYHGIDLYPASDLVMGVKDIVIDRAYFFDNKLHIYGDNFTKWSKVFVNGEKVSTDYESGQCLSIKASHVDHLDTIVVNQMGSSNTIFRSSNEYTVIDPNYVNPEASDETASDYEDAKESKEDNELLTNQ